MSIGGMLQDAVPHIMDTWSSSSTTTTSTIYAPMGVAYGEGQNTRDRNTVTIHELQIPIQPAPRVSPPAYSNSNPPAVFAAADAEVCATATAMRGVNQGQFDLSHAWIADHPLKEPAFPEAYIDLPLGACVRGWITFVADAEVPAASQDAYYSDSTSRLWWYPPG